MFDAVVAGKARLDVIIDGMGKQPREDLITSTLFGTIRFLSPASRGIALEALIEARLKENVEIHLWPSLKGDGEHAEPDVVLRIDSGDSFDYWIVEVKWGAGLGDDQVGREIRTVREGECRRGGLPDGPRPVVGYALLGATSRHVTAMEEALGEFGQCLSIHALPWTTVVERLRSLARSSACEPGLVAWAVLAARFLDGQPEGSVLGEWPDMPMPGACGFTFVTDEHFGFPAALPSVQRCSFDFREVPS